MMNEAQKFQAMRLWLNKPIAQILAALDGEGAGTTPDGTGRVRRWEETEGPARWLTEDEWRRLPGRGA